MMGTVAATQPSKMATQQQVQSPEQEPTNKTIFAALLNFSGQMKAKQGETNLVSNATRMNDHDRKMQVFELRIERVELGEGEGNRHGNEDIKNNIGEAARRVDEQRAEHQNHERHQQQQIGQIGARASMAAP